VLVLRLLALERLAVLEVLGLALALLLQVLLEFAVRALDGVTTFDASCGGLGGCPYAPGASGNVATEDLLYVLDGLGITTGARIDAVMAASTAVAAALHRTLPSRYVQATLASRHR
jgi:isopropylmalate/homocitrate/citramalate synthase